MRALNALLGVLLIAVATPRAAAAASEPDTAVVAGPEVEITALRGRDRLSDVPAATFVFPRERIRASGVARLSTLMATLPGLYGYLQNASGDPIVVDPRGFTANGERSYLKMLVDGQDTRDVENGGVDWDWLFPDEVERLEVVQGPGAWLYGDGSEGGIVNVVRSTPSEPLRVRLGARAGSFGLRTGSGSVRGVRGALAGSGRYSLRYVDGWRDRSRERVYSSGGEGTWTLSSSTRASLDVAWLDADRQDPGTLTPDLLEVERTRAETRTDFNQAKRLLIGGHLHDVRASGEWSLSPYFRSENANQARTLFTQTPIEQTKWHPSRSWTYGGELGWRRPLRVAGREVGLTAGAQLERARLRSSWFDFDFRLVGDLRTRVESRRTTGSVFADARVALDPRTTARIGFREDGIRLAAEDKVAGTGIPAHTEWAASPFVALSRRLFERASAYASYSAAFRVPSLSQLYDRRPIDVFGQTFFLSSPDLEPQRAHSLELGGRWDGADGALAMLTLYSIWVRNEIDFDAATFAYANLDKSRHRGVQGALQHPLRWNVSARANGTWSPTTLEGGPNDGNQINAVPIGTAYGGLTWAPAPGWSIEGGRAGWGASTSTRPMSTRSASTPRSSWPRRRSSSGFAPRCGSGTCCSASTRTPATCSTSARSASRSASAPPRRAASRCR